MELVKVTNENGVNLVSARELHNFLEVKSRFNDWIKNRIEKYGFEENSDYTTLTKNLVNGGKETDYIIKIDMAKELSMVENNDKGREARKYFIECERALFAIGEKERLYLGLFNKDPLVVANSHKALVELETKPLIATIEKQETKIKNLFEQIEDLVEKGRNTTFDIGTTAKLLNYKGLGKTRLFSLLRKQGVLCKNNDPMQKYIDNKYMILVSKPHPYMDEMYKQTRVTVKGLFALGRMLAKWGYESNISEQELIEDIRNLVG